MSTALNSGAPAIEELIAEIQRYLAAVALFRKLGQAPSWRAEAA
jgi:hypothetical protein